MNPLIAAFGRVLAFAYELVPSYGLALLTLTVVAWVVTFPLRVWAKRAQAPLARLQPELAELRRNCVKDPAKLASETRALFKRHGTSPAAGWLPTLLQAPFFLALYRLIRGLTNSPAGSVTFVPSHLPVPSRLYDALSATHVMRSFGIDLAQGGIAAPQASPASAVILVAVVAAGVVAGLVQQRLASSRARRPSGKRSPVERAVAIAPVLVGVWALWLPGALTIYYAASSALRLFEHWMLPPPT